MMRYTSPIRALGIDETLEVLDKNALNLAKKKLLAEIDLSESHSILRGGREMTKDDVLKAFDAMPEVGNWRFHQLIYQDNVLLKFLESNVLDRDDSFLQEPVYDNLDFIAFVSPYFSNSYAQSVIFCLEKRQPMRLNNLLYKNAFLVTEEDAERIWGEVENFLNKKIESIEEIADSVESGRRFEESEIVNFYTKSTIDCLNLLPEGDFDWLRDRYAISLYNLSANLWNKKNYQRAAEIGRNIQMLTLSEYERNLIDERVVFFDNELIRLYNPTAVTSTESNYSFDWLFYRFGWIFLYILIHLLRFGCS